MLTKLRSTTWQWDRNRSDQKLVVLSGCCCWWDVSQRSCLRDWRSCCCFMICDHYHHQHQHHHHHHHHHENHENHNHHDHEIMVADGSQLVIQLPKCWAPLPRTFVGPRPIDASVELRHLLLCWTLLDDFLAAGLGKTPHGSPNWPSQGKSLKVVARPVACLHVCEMFDDISKCAMGKKFCWFFFGGALVIPQLWHGFPLLGKMDWWPFPVIKQPMSLDYNTNGSRPHRWRRRSWRPPWIRQTAWGQFHWLHWRGQAAGNHAFPNQVLGFLANVALSERFLAACGSSRIMQSTTRNKSYPFIQRHLLDTNESVAMRWVSLENRTSQKRLQILQVCHQLSSFPHSKVPVLRYTTVYPTLRHNDITICFTIFSHEILADQCCQNHQKGVPGFFSRRVHGRCFPPHADAEKDRLVREMSLLVLLMACEIQEIGLQYWCVVGNGREW